MRIVIVTFFVSTILAVVAYKFLPVYVTPLMIIRCVEQIADGHSPRVEHKWISLDDMSPSMPVAVMGSEDARFLLHHGFDKHHHTTNCEECLLMAWTHMGEKGL